MIECIIYIHADRQKSGLFFIFRGEFCFFMHLYDKSVVIQMLFRKRNQGGVYTENQC